MKKENVIKGLCSVLAVARIAQENDTRQSSVSLLIDNKDKETLDLHTKYYNEFMDVFNQLI
ncbi:MAG: hypothetical protein BGO84_14430 [Dysgonomonas sp. 37-18]|uniref:hypothetical protein n=1 Tax=uncultured Dysgonomonas sp. TaxID=206096 RepID=UPI00092C3B07|nr:hypothetical protein [uncultured Dysgonomonas sp.]OJX63097.1 MAG: hypothetical protein BGO84_14430 [Dysgonomonas sp. 37-18]